jgi:hypothetical protein
VVKIGVKHPDNLSSNANVGIVIYEKFGIWNTKLRKITISVRKEIRLNKRGEKLQKKTDRKL